MPTSDGLSILPCNLSTFRFAITLASTLQMAILLLLWGAFLFSQLLKAKYDNCSWQFGAVAGGQALLLAALTAAVMRYQSWMAQVRCHPPRVQL